MLKSSWLKEMKFNPEIYILFYIFIPEFNTSLIIHLVSLTIQPHKKFWCFIIEIQLCLCYHFWIIWKLPPFQTPFQVCKQEIVSRVNSLCIQTPNYSKHPLFYPLCEWVNCSAKREHTSAASLVIFLSVPPFICKQI